MRGQITLAALVACTCVGSIVAASCGSPSGGQGPQDSPVSTLYGGEYAWATDLVPWTCVYNIKDYGGSPDEAFAAAQADAVKNGGGVVFFPAGSYAFEANISLASNVVIRGEATTAPAKTGKLPGPLSTSLKTIFTCPNRQHQGVWNFEPNATNLGVVNVFLDQCAVMLWPGLVTSSFATMMESWWFSASDIKGMGSNKLVLSNAVRDVSYGNANPSSPSGNVYPWPFSIAVGVYTDRNALIANNILVPSQRNENTTVILKLNNKPTNYTIPYPYDNRYGIDVNSILLGAVAGHYASPNGPCHDSSAFGGLYPACAPWNYRPGITIRDNWVAQNGRVGISFTGGNDEQMCSPGSGTQVFNNHVEVRANTTALTVDGQSVARGSDTNENRGYMKQGYCSNITANSGHINRQISGLGPYETVDGEGILQQSENGGWGYGDIITGNDLTGGTSGYIANWDLLWTNATSFINNKVNPDQFIGVVLMNDDVVGSPGLTCSGNDPPATISKNGQKTNC